MSWHVLHVRPRCEKKVGDFCAVRAIEHYLPLRSETKVYQRRRVTVEKPVFPGYLFVSCDAVQRTEVLKTNSIVRTITPHNEEDFLHELDQVRKALTVDPSLSACYAVKEGQRVRITGGPFMGIEGMVASLRSRTTVRLNVEMIGQAIAVEIQKEYLEPLD
jgi:transcription antitermination factor NusG